MHYLIEWPIAKSLIAKSQIAKQLLDNSQIANGQEPLINNKLMEIRLTFNYEYLFTLLNMSGLGSKIAAEPGQQDGGEARCGRTRSLGTDPATKSSGPTALASLPS